MALFTKREPCAICGDKVKGLFPWRVEGQLVCNSCYGIVHLPKGMVENMTMESFKGYRAFREENQTLRQQFQETKRVSFGWLSDKIVFDMTNRLFCMDNSLNSTIFEGSCVKSITIREDSDILFQGSTSGLMCFKSSVTDRIMTLAPAIRQWAMFEEMKRRAEREGEENQKSFTYNDDLKIPEPFQSFVVEIHCDHPYWDVITMEKAGPQFNNSHPSAEEYLRAYREAVTSMEELARALMEVAFPGAPEQRVSGNAAVVVGQTATAPVDAVAEIQRYKTLMDQGLITEEEFTAKKRQLLGI